MKIEKIKPVKRQTEFEYLQEMKVKKKDIPEISFQTLLDAEMEKLNEQH